MKTQLHLIANEQGEFAGSDAEISGKGFSGMRFVAQASSQTDFDAWVQSVQQSSNPLDIATYKKLSSPSENNPVTVYAPVEKDLYNGIIMKYMAPSPSGKNMNTMKGMDGNN
jgi:cytochrome o ubiquinol oxidase subunit 2